MAATLARVAGRSQAAMLFEDVSPEVALPRFRSIG
jgi:hypothetical protein